jgi:hypothetical protein
MSEGFREPKPHHLADEHLRPGMLMSVYSGSHKHVEGLEKY